MPRSRNIKPGFFKNDQLGVLEPLARILFAGLWCMADKEGRLEDRPKRIEIEILPYDRDADVNALLQSLHDARLIQRYVVNGEGYIQIVKWKKHQTPHHKEVESEIPSPNQEDAQDQSNVKATLKQDCVNKNDSKPLIPDSLNLIPDSKDIGASAPHAELQKMYHEVLPELPPIRKWTDKRAKAFRARWRDDQFSGLDFWWKYFQHVRTVPFLMGKNARGWQADIDFLLREEKIVKIMEGGYEGNGNG